jgi:hypothetical protein
VTWFNPNGAQEKRPLFAFSPAGQQAAKMGKSTRFPAAFDWNLAAAKVCAHALRHV